MSERAIILCRLSKSGNEGLDRQEKDCQEYAARKGFEVYKVIRANRSAAADKARPDLQEAFADLKAGKAAHLIGWKYDRISRSGIAGLAELLEALKEANASLHLIMEGADPTTSAGRIILSVLSEIAYSEAENAGIRYKRMHAERAAQGKKHNRSYGYDKDGNQIPHEVTLLKEAASHVLAGGSMNQLAIKWTNEGHPTATGKTKWAGKTISRMLQAPSLRGIRMNNGTEMPGNWEPIFTPEEHAQIISAIRTGPSKTHNQTLLGGLGILLCGSCEHPMRAASGFRVSENHTRAPRYSCPSPPEACGKVSISRNLADDKVRDEFIHIIDSWNHPLTATPADTLQAQLEADELSLKELTEARYVHRRISDEAYLPLHDELQTRILETRQQIKARPATVPTEDMPTPGNAAAWWDQASLEEQRRAIKTLIGSAKVTPAGHTGRKANPERVKVSISWGWLMEMSKERGLFDNEDENTPPNP